MADKPDPTAPVEAPERVTLYVCPTCGDAKTEYRRVCHHVGKEHRVKGPTQLTAADPGVAYVPAQHTAPRELAVELARALDEIERTAKYGAMSYGSARFVERRAREALAKARSEGLLGEETGG